MKRMKYVVCYSGGHSSALAAVETVIRHGRKNTILLNHDISGKVEDEDVKRFKAELITWKCRFYTQIGRASRQIRRFLCAARWESCGSRGETAFAPII